MQPIFTPMRRLAGALVMAAALAAGCDGSGTDPANDAGPGPAAPVAPAAPAAPVLSVEGIKALRLDWTDTDGETEYRLVVVAGDAQTRTEWATLPAGTTGHAFEVFLPDLINASYIVRACNSVGCSESPPTSVVSALLNGAVGYFKASAPIRGFGESAALSADGRTLAVGAPSEGTDVTFATGAVYVFARGATGWVQQARLAAASPADGDRFGASVALSSDGRRLAIGTPGHGQGVGAVSVHTWDGGLWTQEWFQSSPLPTGGVNPPIRFGATLAMSADGATLAAGTDGGHPTVVVFARGDTGWQTQANLSEANTGEYNKVAVSADGNTLVIGYRNGNAGLGFLTVYERTGGVWQGTGVQLTASNAGSGDALGWSVSISGDGQTIAAGALFEDSAASGVDGSQADGLLNAGAVYVFSRSGAAWAQQAYIKASNPGDFDGFGHAVALSADGNRLVASALEESSSAQGLAGPQNNNGAQASGAAYLFQRDGSVWRQTGYIKGTVTEAYDRFGDSVALSGDGATLAVGAGGEDSTATGVGGDQTDNGLSSSGAVYLY